MKKALADFIKNDWAVTWFVFGVVFFIMAAIDAFNGNNEKSLGEIGICLACNARSEVKVLLKRINEDQGGRE